MTDKTASGAPMPPPCDPKILKNGVVVAVLDAPSEHAEEWVKTVAARSGVPVDWHYIGGRAVVKALAKNERDLGRVHAAIAAAPRDTRTPLERMDAIIKPEMAAAYTGSRVTVLQSFSGALDV